MLTLVNVIEPQLGQLVGAFMQRVSFREHALSDIDHRLVIIQRKASSAESIAVLAERLGFQTAVAPPDLSNPYMNRWRCLQVMPELIDRDQVALLDWDMLRVSGADAFPDPEDARLRARANPVELYADLAAALHRDTDTSLIEDDGRVASSINGGLLIASGTTLKACHAAHVRWLRRVRATDPDTPDWMAEQLSLSLAAGEVGWSPVEDAWNVTPGSPVKDADVIVWHYNDGVDATRELKQHLLDVVAARDQIRLLDGRWPTVMQQFRRYYDVAVNEHVFASFLQ